MGSTVFGRDLADGASLWASAILLGVAVTAPTSTAITDVDTARTYAVARYDRSAGTVTVWDNGPDHRPDDGTKARLRVVDNTTALTFTDTHEWRAGVNGRSRTFALPDTVAPGDDLSIQLCSLDPDGGALECRVETARG